MTLLRLGDSSSKSKIKFIFKFLIEFFNNKLYLVLFNNPISQEIYQKNQNIAYEVYFW